MLCEAFNCESWRTFITLLPSIILTCGRLIMVTLLSQCIIRSIYYELFRLEIWRKYSQPVVWRGKLSAESAEKIESRMQKLVPIFYVETGEVRASSVAQRAWGREGGRRRLGTNYRANAQMFCTGCFGVSLWRTQIQRHVIVIERPLSNKMNNDSADRRCYRFA